jgi:hypothetical protein
LRLPAPNWPGYLCHNGTPEMMNRLQFSEYQDFYIWHEYCLALNKQKHKNSSKERDKYDCFSSPGH